MNIKKIISPFKAEMAFGGKVFAVFPVGLMGALLLMNVLLYVKTPD